MKHYHQFTPPASPPQPNICAPVSGTVDALYQENGTQVHIRPGGYPAFSVFIFHIVLASPVNVGDHVSAGQLLGTGTAGKWIDFAVSVNTP